jgi:hypothetical protein
MARMINGTLFVTSFDPTGNPGEYTFTNAVYDNQADATGQGANDVQVGFIIYIPALDPFTFVPVPGISHRYKITAISYQDFTNLSATILWDEDGSEIDVPQNASYSIIAEDTPNLHLGLIPSRDVYANLEGGMSENAHDNDLLRIVDKLGVTGPQGLTGIQGGTGLMGPTGVQGVTGILGIDGVTGVQGATGIQGVTGIMGIDGETGVQGATGIQGQTGIQGPTGAQGITGGVGIYWASELPLGTPPDGTYADGIFPWVNTTMTAVALDDVNELLLAISPAPPGALNGSLVLSNTTKYNAILPTGLSSAWYQDSSVAGNIIADYVVDNTYNLANASPTTTFKCGSIFGGDEGTVYHVLDGTNDSSRGVLSGVGTSGNIQITSIATYNSIWRKANAQINYTQTTEGYKKHAMRYQTTSVNQLTNNTKFWYDDVNGTPGFPSDSTITQSVLSSTRYLSGIRYYYTGDTFDMTSSITNIAKKCIRPTNPVSYSMPGLALVNLAISGASFAWDGTYNFSINDALDTANVYSIDARLTITGTKPAGTTANKLTLSENRLVNTYSPTYSTNGDITMFDERYRWKLSNDFSLIPSNYSNPTGDWTSSDLLSSGDGQLYNSTWYYPSINYTTGYLPAQNPGANYSGFSGEQVVVWATNIGVAHSSMRIVFTGINYTDISADGSGNLNLEIRLPNETGWLDCGRSFGDGNGCRNDGGSSGTTLAITFGTYTSTDSSGVVFVKTTLRNSSAAKASRMVISGT